MEVNERNTDSWFPLTTSFVPGIGDVKNETGMVILGRNAQGDVVATQAGKLVDYSNTNFKQEAEALRFFYGSGYLDTTDAAECPALL